MIALQEIQWATEGETWVEYLVKATVQIPSTSRGDLPPYVFWPNPTGNPAGETTTRPGYGPNNHPYVRWQRVQNAQLFTDCQIAGPDVDGDFVIYGYDYVRISPLPYEWMVDPSDIQMAYTYIADTGPAGVDLKSPGEVVNRDRPSVVNAWVSGRECHVQLWLPGSGEARLEFFDVAGRSLKTIDLTGLRAGAHHVRWDGIANNGARVPSGVYWAAVVDGGRTSTRKFVVLN